MEMFHPVSQMLPSLCGQCSVSGSNVLVLWVVCVSPESFNSAFRSEAPCKFHGQCCQLGRPGRHRSLTVVHRVVAQRRADRKCIREMP